MSIDSYLTGKVLHLCAPPAGTWVLTLMSAVLDSPNIEVRARYSRWAESGLGELAGALASKLEMIPVSVDRVNASIRTLHRHLVDDIERVTRFVGDPAACYQLRSETLLVWELLTDLDSLFFEVRSSYEMTHQFLRTFVFVILNQKLDKQEVECVLSADGDDLGWIDDLRRTRNLFSHNTAPWIALDVTRLSPFQFELILLKRNVHRLENPDDFIHLRRCRAMVEGYLHSLDQLHAWLTAKLREPA